MKLEWCWRCKSYVPMLEDHEQDEIRKIDEESIEYLRTSKIEELIRNGVGFADFKKKYFRDRRYKNIMKLLEGRNRHVQLKSTYWRILGLPATFAGNL